MTGERFRITERDEHDRPKRGRRGMIEYEAALGPDGDTFVEWVQVGQPKTLGDLVNYLKSIAGRLRPGIDYAAPPADEEGVNPFKDNP